MTTPTATARTDPGFARLAPRELRVAEAVSRGLRNKEIAAELGTTEQVIKNYVRSVFDKLGCDSRLQLALRYVEYARSRP